MTFPGGVINVLKPPGMTSHDVVSYIRRQYGQKRVGHAGTLDPAAAGVLPVFLGKATRLIEYFADDDKSYRAEIILGVATDTGDDTGKVLCSQDVIMPETEALITALNSFRGRQEQIPPMYSAIKVDGKKMYELARAGITVAREARTIDISNIGLIRRLEQGFSFDVTCSKGTYIRSLCEDIGKKLGYPAMMSFLVRTRVGAFALEQAHTLEEIAVQPLQVLQPADLMLGRLPTICLSAAEFTEMIHGRPVICPDTCYPADERVRMYDEEKRFVGIGRLVQSPVNLVLKPEKIMFTDPS
ncbi:MAG TPA: tRNA pseudouridine(55) synthase TruB [Patescibacteria group bacterium]|nr:tRNA pseudouridine(55) synthase TruB [Patescibacteria group bacterium]